MCFTDLKLSIDNAYCNVYVDSRNRNEVESSVGFLNDNAGLFRNYLAKEMNVYKVPTIRFYIDAVVDNVIKINKIFNEINKKKS
ncbi:30S ribosome-binding factor RbfA [bacterium]|nr:30S ribosome-binding factor RbfA [bacterium]